MPYTRRPPRIHAFCRHLRAIEAFPALGLMIFAHSGCDNATTAKSMVLRGKPLREVAKMAGVPWTQFRIGAAFVREHSGEIVAF
jgi:hypothetical protein